MLKILLFLCFFCALSLGATPKDTIIIAVENQIDRINPIFSEDHDASIGLIFSGLTRFDEDLSLKPDLASSWKISKDALEYDFELRADVFWHDGVKFSAKDVEFTLKAINNSKFNSPLKANFDMIKEIKIIDDTHIKITLTSPFAAFLDALSVGILPSHLLEKENLNTTKFNQAPIGTGAFKFKAWQKNQYLSLEANENYHLGKVQSKKLILKHISDPNLSAIELKNGSVDVGLISFELFESFKDDKNFKILVEKSADYRALMYNFKNDLFKDKELRIALNYAVNKELIVEKLLHSLGKVAHHPLQNSWANDKNHPKTVYDPQKASEILASAGWVKNSKGVLEKRGKELEFDLYTMSNDPLRVALIKFLSSEFAKLGIKTRIFAKPAGSFDYSRVDSFLVGWGSPYDPDLHTFRVFESSQFEVWNFGSYSNEKVDLALKKARNVVDKKKRKEHYSEFIRALSEDPAFLFLVYLDFPLVYNKEIKGIRPQLLGHHGVGFTHNAWQWHK
ncbi:ABC transporter substrate-binding protein [Campylobacter troglodytis]|uniref:ABC transporter substrate-binding protein n=1 Tax=Campylobacter troglodytis TaxID=654363 RepID=UPI00115B461D|nr:ABC transporter substrate-binding protein [Campylobacter troglodytis]TQR59650.1 peptide ABC transporter substrate-binding protein [Campylobacter troglodytis]